MVVLGYGRGLSKRLYVEVANPPLQKRRLWRAKENLPCHSQAEPEASKELALYPPPVPSTLTYPLNTLQVLIRQNSLGAPHVPRHLNLPWMSPSSLNPTHPSFQYVLQAPSPTPPPDPTNTTANPSPTPATHPS